MAVPSMTAAQLVALIAEAQQPLRGDIQAIGTRMTGLETRVNHMEEQVTAAASRVVRLEESIDEKIRTALAKQTSSAASTASSTTASPPRGPSLPRPGGGGGGGWRPQLVILRGWSPHGAPAATRIGRSEALSLANSVLNALPTATQSKLVLCAPYGANYQLAFRCRNPDEIHCLKDAIADAVAGLDLTVKGQAVRVSCESSPQRRAEYSKYYDALRALKAADPTGEGTSWEADPRSLTVLHVRTLETMGALRDGQWWWQTQTLSEVGLEIADGHLQLIRGSKRPAETQGSRVGGDIEDEDDADLAQTVREDNGEDAQRP